MAYQQSHGVNIRHICIYDVIDYLWIALGWTCRKIMGCP